MEAYRMYEEDMEVAYGMGDGDMCLVKWMFVVL